MNSRRIYFGPPGTGKTSTLIRDVQGRLTAGVRPSRIGFGSFTKRAIKEARDKAAEITTDDLPHFRTAHSTAYHLLGLMRGDVVQSEHIRTFGQAIGVPFKCMEDASQALWEGAMGDRCLGLYALAKARCTSLEHEWRAANLDDLPWPLVTRTIALYERFKSANALWDFHDMIEKAEGTLDVDVLYLDEAQDTSTAQWKFWKRVASHVPTVIFAGDDDQAIYAWSGADPDQLLRLQGERVVLPKSYRLPVTIKSLADTISGRIVRRIPKMFADNGTAGEVAWLPDIAQVDLHEKGTWLLLARSNYQLGELRAEARRQGVVYQMADGAWSTSIPAIQAAQTYERLRKGLVVSRTSAKEISRFVQHKLVLPQKDTVQWADCFAPEVQHFDWMQTLTEMPDVDREYVRALRRSGESLTAPGRVRIGTVHSAKGAEADHVVLLTDISERVESSGRVDQDAELRVQYVAVTRARKRLLLIQPATHSYWTL